MNLTLNKQNKSLSNIIISSSVLISQFKLCFFSFYFFLFLVFSLQITEALSYLHYTKHVIHKNVCPSSILVTKKGTWKLAGLEFMGKHKVTKLNEGAKRKLFLRKRKYMKIPLWGEHFHLSSFSEIVNVRIYFFISRLLFCHFVYTLWVIVLFFIYYGLLNESLTLNFF